MQSQVDGKPATHYAFSDDGKYVRVYFSQPPNPLIRESLRSLKWKWCQQQRCWEAPRTFRNEQVAKELAAMYGF